MSMSRMLGGKGVSYLTNDQLDEVIWYLCDKFKTFENWKYRTPRVKGRRRERMKLFEYAILYHGKLTKKQEDEGAQAEHRILQPPTHILARDEREVTLIAARQIPAEYQDRLDRVEIAVRPF